MKTKLKTKLTSLSLALLAAFAFSSCANTGGGPAGGTHTMGNKPGWQMANEGMAGSAGSASTEAVMCDKCKTVWVTRPITSGFSGRNPVTVLRDVKTMTCPDCESAVATFFKTGSMKHACSTCGGTMTHCTQH